MDGEVSVGVVEVEDSVALGIGGEFALGLVEVGGEGVGVDC